MAASDYALAEGLRDTRSTFEEWQSDSWSVLGPWIWVSFAIGVALLIATWIVSNLVTADLTPVGIDGVTRPVDGADLLEILARNSVVLAFHATACVAGFIAGASMPIAARTRTGFWRWLHIKAGQFAITYVVAVTLFSLSVQALVLGFQAAALGHQLDLSTAELIISALPQALIELTALFLPLAAWIQASRRGIWNQLLAATFVTVAVAVPMLVIASVIELYLWPQILISISPAV